MTRRPRVFATLAGVLLAAAPAAQLTVKEFPIPRSGAFPHDPGAEADGIVWYTDQRNSYIGRFDPTTRQFRDWPTPTPSSGPHGITVAPDGFVWYTAQDSGRLGRVDPKTGQIREFVMPSNASRPHTPIAHRDAIWFTAQSNSTYGRFDPKTSKTQVWNVPSGSRPYGIIPAPDGSLWIALFGTNALARVDPTDGSNKIFRLPSTTARPRRIAATADGLIWYTDYSRGYLGQLDPGTGKVQEWRSPAPRPYGIAVGTDGRIWFNATDVMVAFDPGTAKMSPIPVPTRGAVVRHMISDDVRGRLWLALSGTQRLGCIQLDPPVAFFGTACPGSSGTPEFAITGSSRIGRTATFAAGNTAAPAGVLFLGGSNTSWLNLRLPFDLTPLGFRGCFVNTAWDIALFAGAPGPVRLAFPWDRTLGGLRFYAQWVLLGDPAAALVTTRGASVRVIAR